MTEQNNLIPTSGTPTAIVGVDSQLDKLWAKLAGTAGQNALLRATTLTLVLYTNNLRSVPALISQITATHPCRMIVIGIDDGLPDTLTALPTLFCRPSLGSESQRHQVCCEEILLIMGRDAVSRVAAAVQALLLPDLPVYLYYEGNISPDDPILNGLTGVIDGLIVDSAVFEDIPASLHGMVRLHDMRHFHAEQFDLNWQRLLPWRSMLAQLFDRTDERLFLKSIREVGLTHHNARAEALLFFGWLISRLGWQLVPGGDANTWMARSGQDEVILRLHPTVEGAVGLQSVVLTTEQSTRSVIYSDDCNCLTATNGHSMTLHLSPQTPGTLVSMILDTPRRDHVFEEARATALTLSTEMHTLSQRAGVVIADSPQGLARLAARSFVQAARHAIDKHGRFVVALSGGSTPKALYELLNHSPYRDQIAWAKVHIFWGDERNVSPDDVDSNQRMAREALLNHVPIPPDNIHGLLAGQLSAEEAAAHYAADIRTFFALKEGELPEFDLVLLGLGVDGHTASLFPHTSALMAQGTRLFVANPVPKLNTTRLTLTADVINRAANAVFLVSGKAKADILHTVFKGPLQPDDFPAQRIRPPDGSLTVIVDRDAAAKLRETG